MDAAGGAGHGRAQHGTALHSTAQQNRAERSTARHAPCMCSQQPWSHMEGKGFLVTN